MFTNLEIIMRMYYRTAIYNCSDGRTFSVLKRALVMAVFSIETKLVEQIDLNDTIKY